MLSREALFGGKVTLFDFINPFLLFQAELLNDSSVLLSKLLEVRHDLFIRLRSLGVSFFQGQKTSFPLKQGLLGVLEPSR